MDDSLQAFIDGLEDGVILIDRDFRIERVNQAIALKFVGRDGVVGQLCCDVLPCHRDPLTEPVHFCPAAHAFRSSQPRRLTEPLTLGGSVVWVDIVASPLFGPDGAVERIVEVWRDVTEFKELEASYERRVEQLKALRRIGEVSSGSLELRKVFDDSLALILDIVRADAGGIYLLDPRAHVLRLRAYRSISSEVAQDIDFLHLGEGFSGRVVESGEPVIVDDIRTDPRLTRQILNKEELHSLVAVPLKSQDGIVGALWLASRSSKRRFGLTEADWLQAVGRQLALAVENGRLYEEIRRRDSDRAELLAHMMTAQEDERKRVARDLHDETVQELAALSLAAERIIDRLAGDRPDITREISGLKKSISRIADGIHEVVADLRPGLLDELGLPAAARWYACTKLEPLGIRLAFETEDLPVALDPQTEIAVFRVMQEAINNVAQHAEAHSVRIGLNATPSRLMASVEDDGRGFNASELTDPSSRGRSLGLLGMRERMSLVGGDLTVDSRPGGGTRIEAKIPLTR